LLTFKLNLTNYCQKSPIQSAFFNAMFASWVAGYPPNPYLGHLKKGLGTAALGNLQFLSTPCQPQMLESQSKAATTKIFT